MIKVYSYIKGFLDSVGTRKRCIWKCNSFFLLWPIGDAVLATALLPGQLTLYHGEEV